MSKASELREQAAAKFKEAKDLVGEKSADQISSEDMTKFENIMADAKKLDEAYLGAAKGEEKVMGLKERLEFYHGKATGGQSLPFGDGVKTVQNSSKSIGQQFVDSGEYKALKESGALASDNANFKTSPFKTERKASTDVINTTAGQPGAALVLPQYLPGILPLPQRPLRIRDLFSEDTTGSDVLSYAAQSAFDNSAAPVAQATSLATGAKPQSSIAWARRTTPVEAIATWMAATRRQLADAGQTRSLIDNQLNLMLKIVEEDQLVSGNGTSPNLKGLLNVTGVQTLDISGASSAKFQNIDAIRDAIKLIKTGTARADADAVVLHPTDAAILDEQKDDQHRYIGNGPFGIGPSTLWRRPIIESEAITAGHAIVGAWKIGGTVFQREPVAIFASDSHSDFFIRNLVAVLAEERLALAVYFPTAFCYVTFKATWA
jgi:HK97 family phage major capsid protein